MPPAGHAAEKDNPWGPGLLLRARLADRLDHRDLRALVPLHDVTRKRLWKELECEFVDVNELTDRRATGVRAKDESPLLLHKHVWRLHQAKDVRVGGPAVDKRPVEYLPRHG